MKVVTVINNINDLNFHLLKLSCFVNGLDLIVLVSKHFNFHTRRIKDYLLYDYLSAESMDLDEIVFFTDGTDAIFLSDEKEIVTKYGAFDREIVFSAETGCWPDIGLISEYQTHTIDSPYKYLNSGGFIGKARHIKKFLEDGDYESGRFPESNQYLWTQRFLKHPDKIGLDTDCKIFCTFSPEIGEELIPDIESGSAQNFSAYYNFKKKWLKENFEIFENRILNRQTNSNPCHLHFNGHSKLLLDNQFAQLIYSRITGYQQVQYYFEQ